MSDSLQHQIKIEFITGPGEIFTHQKLEIYKFTKRIFEKKRKENY